MKKSKVLMFFYIAISSLLVSFISLNVGFTIALYNKVVEGNGTYGQVALRSYYEKGSGTINDPFVITRPRHLYNLSRLQGLGVYGEKKYFALGMVGLGGDTSGLPMCYVDETSQVKPYLDMSKSKYDVNPINAIGSEALPFYGEFDGQNVEIKNLNVYASPEDAGLFGYTAHASVVKNLFMSNVTINAMGYTVGYADLYNPNSDLGETAYFIYNPNDGESSSINFTKDNKSSIVSYYFDTESTDTFAYDEDNINNSSIPSVTIQSPDDNYDYYPILSGGLIKIVGNTIVPDLDRVFEFFGDNMAAEGATQASSAVSLVVSSVDNYGIKHSKVLYSLEFDFTLNSSSSDHITMAVHLGGDHANNIGLVIGHCDGSAINCYVYNGSFKMNNGDAVTLSEAGTYSGLPNGSNLGLIGVVGGTVQNILASESDINAKEGKSIGVLDFTTVYKDIIGSTSFNGSETYASGDNGGVTYSPILTSKYINYLRKNENASTNLKYVTLNNSSVSFRGKSIISNTDLGVFTIATDNGSDGFGPNAGINLQNSVVRNDSNLAINGKYYIYYATGEYCNSIYNGTTGITFDMYRDSFNSDSPSQIVLGNHFPAIDTTTKETFFDRNQRHNYYVRFALDPDYRSSNGFYFSDVDDSSVGGSYMAKYFNTKLVDQNNIPIPNDSPRCGLMLKDTFRQEIRSLSASFALQDLSNSTAQAQYLEDDDDNKYISNMVNFEIKTDFANVTVVAAPTEYGKGAALGVYRLDDADFSNNKFNQKYNKPDYAFFMPDDDHLSYFDYRVNKTKQNGKRGEIGVYTGNEESSFVIADESTNATVANDYARTGDEYGHDSDVPRLFAHTFYLPRGRYCFGSATGKDSAAAPKQTTAKIFYVCAQGQDDGQMDFDDNIFSGNDTVEKVDFLKRPRFDPENSDNDIIVEYTDTYNSNDMRLANQRCYVALVNSDRSLFADTNSEISFTYNQTSNTFEITSTTLSAMTHVAVNNYPHSLPYGDEKELIISLFGNTSSGLVVVYPSGG